jgi:hypothetical protein
MPTAGATTGHCGRNRTADTRSLPVKLPIQPFPENVIVVVAASSAVMVKPAAGKARRRYAAISVGGGDETTIATLFGWSTFAVTAAVRGSENCCAGPLR